MAARFKKFSAFCATLLPHEIDYLLDIQQFEDVDRLEILRLIQKHQGVNHFPFDETIDKRKYSHLKNWISQRLAEIDVDLSLKRLLSAEEAILTDQITPLQEKRLLKSLQTWDESFFYFVKWFEVLKVLREDLQIRVRYEEVNILDGFLKKHRPAYERSVAVSQSIEQMTNEIIEQYQTLTGDTRHHIDSLSKTFRDESLDGYNRFKAFIRLIFIGFNYRDFDFLRPHFDYFDKLLTSGVSYSKRILLNYYSNRLLLHSRFREYQLAEKYGYLSIKVKNQDYLMYLNNLTAVLLRNHKYEDALRILQEGSKEAKETGSDHNKTGYVSFYVETLNRLKRYRSAANHAAAFLSLYKREIFKYRWHFFFTVYIEALIQQHRYKEINKVAKRYKLLDRDKQYSQRAGSTPIISWYILIAQFEEGLIHKKQFNKRMGQHLTHYLSSLNDEQWSSMIAKINPFLPTDTKEVLYQIRESHNEHHP
ncbi:MAG: hypothetical protein HKN87_09285 [Saprospiraceae bacterium]|nr:hypothetical protein [Saprospiraceae bacterium]